MEERRKLPRKYLLFYSRVFDRATGMMLGHIADLTYEGAMLISDLPIETGKDFRLRLDLPDGFAFDRSHMDFEGRAVWCQPDVDPNFYNTGFKLSKVRQEDFHVIDHINATYSMRE